VTYGDLKFRLTQMFPGVSLDLIEGWIGDRYAEILGELPWQRQRVTGILQTVAPYATGTVTLTNGSTTVTGSGTVFTSAMTGRGLRVTGRDEIYEFTYVSGTSGTLDRAYEGTTGSGKAYKIFQQVYVLPSDARMLDDNAFESFPYGPLTRMHRSQLDQSAPGRTAFGIPEIWAPYMDDGSTPPRLQVELYPIPDRVIGIPFTYSAEFSSLSTTSQILQVWMQPTALLEGTAAKILRWKGDAAGAALAKAEANDALKNMRTSEAQSLPKAQMQMDDYYIRHRAKRWCR
jgi:hypothetical protein